MRFSLRSALAAWARCIARAARLGRDVAVEVLTESLAHDPERLRRFEHWPHIPIILLSGYPQDLPKEMLNQVDAFVWKGGDSSELLTTIRSVLNGQALLGTESLTVESPERLSKQSRAGV